MNGCAVKVVLGDERVGGAILLTAALLVLTLCIRSPLRQFIHQLEGNHSHQKGNEKQRRYQDEESFSVEHNILPL